MSLNANDLIQFSVIKTKETQKYSYLRSWNKCCSSNSAGLWWIYLNFQFSYKTLLCKGKMGPRWLELSPFSKKVLGWTTDRTWGLSLWSFHVFMPTSCSLCTVQKHACLLGFMTLKGNSVYVPYDWLGEVYSLPLPSVCWRQAPVTPAALSRYKGTR